MQLQSTVSESQAVAAPPLPALGRNRPFLLLFAAYTLSLFGNSFHNIALNLWVLTSTGSAKLMSVILVMNLLISSALGPITGTLADRMDRRRLMLVSDLVRSFLVLLIALCIGIGDAPFILIAVLTGMTTAAGLLHSPAFQASLVTIVGREHVQRAAGLLNLSDNISRTVGFAVGGIFVAAFGGAWAIAIDGFTFIVSFLLVIVAGAFSSAPSLREHRKKFKEDFLAGLRYMASNPFVKAVTILSPTLLVFFMSSSMLTQVMAVQIWHASPFHFGLLEACIPLGYMVGSGIVVALGPKLRKRGRLIMLNLWLIGPSYIALSFTASALAGIPVILIIGFMFSFCTLLVNIVLRLEVSEEIQGRVFGTLGSLMSVLPSVGLAISSYLADLYGSNTVMLVCGSLLLLFGIYSSIRFKAIRQYD